MQKSIFGLFLMSVILTSCIGYTPLTKELIYKYHISDDALSKIQVYNSDKVILHGGYQYDNVYITGNGTLIIKDQSSSENLILNKKTPGTVSRILNDGKILVRFEKDNISLNSRLIVFGGDYNQYHIMASWNGTTGRMLYDSKNYYIAASESKTILLIKKKSLRHSVFSARKIKGRKITDK